MKTKVYYGEYTLRYWIDLILSKNVVIPSYQRWFVWKEKESREFIDSLSKKEFVPPVTIFKKECDVIITNRKANELSDVREKIYTRDLLGRDRYENINISWWNGNASWWRD